MQSVSVRLAHCPAQAARGQRYHDLRLGRVPAYVDAARSSTNSVLIAPAKEQALRDLCQARRAARNTQRAMKSNAAVATTGIITFSTEAQPIILALPVEEQNRLYRAVVDRIALELNNTVTGLVVHRDETAPHAHFQMPAYTLDGIPMSKSVKIDMAKRLQDIAGEVYQAHGITRGKPKSQRMADGEPLSAWLHRSVRTLHADLPGEIAAAQQALESALDKRRKNESLAQKAQDALEAGRGDLDKLQRNLLAYQRRAEAAQQAATEQETRLAQLRQIEAELSQSAPPLEKAKTHQYEVVKGKNVLGMKQTETVKLVTVDEVNALGRSYKAREAHVRAQAARQVQAERDRQARLAQELRAQQAQIDTREKELITRDAHLQQQESRLDQLAISLRRRPCSQSTRAADWPQVVQADPVAIATQVLDAISQVRYGTLVQVFDQRVLIPPQQATPAQKAAALYRVTRETAKEQGWPGIEFTVQDQDLAKRLHALCVADGLRANVLLQGMLYAPHMRDTRVLHQADDALIDPNALPTSIQGPDKGIQQG